MTHQLTVADADLDSSYVYDPQGRVQSLSNANLSRSYSYDIYSRLNRKSVTIDSLTRTSSYSYDDHHRPTAVTYHGGEVVTTKYGSPGVAVGLSSSIHGDLVDEVSYDFGHCRFHLADTWQWPNSRAHYLHALPCWRQPLAHAELLSLDGGRQRRHVGDEVSGFKRGTVWQLPFRFDHDQALELRPFLVGVDIVEEFGGRDTNSAWFRYGRGPFRLSGGRRGRHRQIRFASPA